MNVSSAALIVQKLGSVCAEVFGEQQPTSMEGALLLLRRLDEEAIHMVLSLFEESFVLSGDQEFLGDLLAQHQSFFLEGWESCDWEDLLCSEEPSEDSKAILEASRLALNFEGASGPFVSLDKKGAPDFAIDFSIGVSGRRQFVALDIFSAQQRWTGLNSLGLFPKGRIATIALTENVVGQQTHGAKPWFCRYPDSDTLDYFIRKAKASSNPYKVCDQCEQVLDKLAFSDSSTCDSCLGVIH